MRKLLGLLMAFLCFTGSLLAQKTITGKVTDEKGAPVPNASVVAKGTSSGTTTNADGTFSFTIPAGTKTLIISSVGFRSKEVGIGAATHHEISLINEVTEAEEIVVTGYTNVKKTQFAGAATVVTASNTTTNRPVGSFNHLLQGKVPGMLVNSGSGQPGNNASVTIRGVQSIQGAGAQPLYIIDGVPVSAGDFQSLNPNDFETITVLKDANAAAMYGARAGVGVIVITTRQGRNGATQITARSQMGITLAPNFDRLNLMSTDELLAYEERIGLLTGSSNAAFGAPGWVWSRNNPANASLPEATLQQYDHNLDSVRAINTNLRDLMFRNGLSQTYEINVRGGNDKTQFFLSTSYFNQEGIDLTAALKRYTTRFNINHNLNHLKIQWNNLIGYSITNYAEGDQQGNSTRNPFQMIYRAKPYDNPYKADGTLNFGGGGSNLALKTLANMLEGIEHSSYAHKNMKLNSGLTLSYNILDNLVLKNVLGIDVSWNQLERYIDPGSYVGSIQTYQSGLASESFGSTAQITNTTSLGYNTTFAEKHDISAGVYFEAVRVYNKGLGFTLRNLNPLLQHTGQGATDLPTNGAATMPQSGSSARSGYGIRSYFANINYSFDKRFSLSGTIRRDGTSRIFNEANKEITTWSAGAIWNVIKENFMSSQNVFSDLRLRASYGVVPNIGSIPTSSYGAVLWSVSNYAGNQVPRYSSANYAGSTTGGINPAAPGNSNFQIEKIQKTNIGVDFAVWKNRARFTFDLYKNKTIDLFVNQPLSATTGFGSLDINAGIMTNKGIEFLADVDVVKNKNFTVNVGFNHSINKNNIEDLGLVNEYFLGTFVIRKGLPYGSHYTYHYMGTDPGTGKPIFETADGGTTNERAQAGQFAKFGTYLPKHVGGFNFDIRWKRFSVYALFSYQFDVVRSNNTRNWITRGTTGYTIAVNQSRELLTNQWQKPGDNVYFNSPSYDRDFTSSDLENAKFLRFRNLNFAYEIPAFNISGRSIIKGATVYANFQNLAIWSPWRGVDPEDNNNISLVEYPNPRMIVFGLDIKL
ncbi:MAG: SusC/RagA family TonB-linked outer membrane protein [Chitinophagaceae bacterium]